MADTRTIHPMPMKPVEDPPTVRGPTSHSPLPMETPSAIMLGPRTYRNSCFVLIRPLILKTSSGSGKSVNGNGGRLFLICIVSPDTTTFSLGSLSIISTTDLPPTERLRDCATVHAAPPQD